MTGSEFCASLPVSMADPAYAPAVLAAVRQSAMPLEWAEVTSRIDGHEATFFVTCDAVSIGEGDDIYRVNADAITAQRIADVFGALLSTPRLEDSSWLQASARCEPVLLTADAHMSDVARGLEHSAQVTKRVDGRTGLVRGVGKQWVLSNRLVSHPLGLAGAVNYGFHTAARVGLHGPFQGRGVVLWQDVGTRHNDKHIDYSQTVTLVRADCVVDGNTMRTVDVMTSARLAWLISYEGPLRMTRYPRAPSA